jgi:hypothetical protein
LSKLSATINDKPLIKELQNILLEELNVKSFDENFGGIKDKYVESREWNFVVVPKVTVDGYEIQQEGKAKTVYSLKLKVETEITPELKAEGLARELLRKVQVLRKEMGLSIEDKIDVFFETEDKNLKDAVNNKVFLEGAQVKNLKEVPVTGRTGEEEEISGRELTAEGNKIWVGIKKG